MDSLATALSFGLERSMGQADFYLFVMSTPVVAKLQFVHLIVFNAQSRPAQGEITQAATA